MFSGFKTDLPVLCIIITLLTGFGQLQSVSDFPDLFLGFHHEIGSEDMAISSLRPI